jgi:hypothetical protein
MAAAASDFLGEEQLHAANRLLCDRGPIVSVKIAIERRISREQRPLERRNGPDDIRQ